jgi:stromal membrane-associated protein
MVKWGNAKANLYWEHEWPKDMQPSDRNMDQFIRAKYERKQYAMKGEIPDPSTLGSIVCCSS